MIKESEYEKIRCDVCLGKKYILSPGAMIKKCKKCEGEGFLYKKKIINEDELEEKSKIISSDLSMKKKGRPKINK